MHTNLSPLIRTLGHAHGLNIILSIATTHWLQVLVREEQLGDIPGFLAELAQFLRTQHYEVIRVREEPPYLNITAYRASR